MVEGRSGSGVKRRGDVLLTGRGAAITRDTSDRGPRRDDGDEQSSENHSGGPDTRRPFDDDLVQRDDPFISPTTSSDPVLTARLANIFTCVAHPRMGEDSLFSSTALSLLTFCSPARITKISSALLSGF